MSTSDLNESSVENGTNKMPGTSYNHTVEQSGLKKFRDPNLDRNQKEDEGENNGWLLMIWHEGTQADICNNSDFDYYFLDESSCKAILLKYLCGAGKHDENEDEKLKEHMAKVAELKQNKMAALCLNIGLVVILLIGTFLYFFWSFWRYEPA